MQGDRTHTHPGLCRLTSFSLLWLPATIPDKTDRITTCLTVSIDCFLAELMGTLPGISCEVQYVGALSRFVFTLALNWPLPSQWEYA